MMVYPIGTSGQKVILADNVVEHILRHRQLRRSQREAGGQLFARFEESQVIIVDVTGPRPTDERTRTTYVPDRDAEKAEILELHSRGLHYVGDWHTHPIARPRPSARDLESMTECFGKSWHSLNGFLLLIAGQIDPPDGFSVTIHDERVYHVLSALDAATKTSNQH